MKDDLGTRMKENYEYRTRTKLPRRTHTIIRLDGKAFHSFTSRCDRPYDTDLMGCMDMTALALCEQIQGCVFAYIQSDEISLLLQDFKGIKTEAWFDGNIQKITSISSSIATIEFNEITMPYSHTKFVNKKALFDSRVFTISDIEEVVNYFIWRQQDATRNSIQMAAQSQYSHKELNCKNGSQLQDMLHEKGINWNDYPVGCKRGRSIIKVDGEWNIVEPPIFTTDRDFIKDTVLYEKDS